MKQYAATSGGSEEIRLTIDYPEDMLFAEKIYQYFGNNDFSSTD